MTIMRGWVRDATPVHLTFWFQVTQFGFDKQTGGKFIVEFTAQNPGRHTSLRDRKWRLLDDQSRREVIRINNAVIASLPGPSASILNGLPEFLRATYLSSFRLVDETSPAHTDVWFRYATRGDAQQWSNFVALRLPFLVTECERSLENQQARTSSMGGVVFKKPEEDA
ncbi:MAG: hypothetical protein M3082_07270 [Candidatus Dormibacteraeota bacterium]|nr:hypothetical protein [Candidatus Dormibacteraeota bacterium]